MIETVFGVLRRNEKPPESKMKPIIRGLNWCQELVEESPLWSVTRARGTVALQRNVNGKKLFLFPLIAAKQDLGDFRHGFERNHLAVAIDGRSMCVIGPRKRQALPHVDLVASCLQLFSVEKPPVQFVPSTLRMRLYPDECGNATRYFPRRQQTIEAFNALVTSDDEAYAFIDEYPEDWPVLRDQLSMEAHPNTLQTWIERIFSLEHEANNDDILWALNQRSQQDQTAFQARLPSYMGAQYHQSIIRYALSRYEATSAENAWEVYAQHMARDDHIAWLFHGKLRGWKELLPVLIPTTEGLYQMSQNLEFGSQALSWLSHHKDMEHEILRITPSLDFHYLRHLMWNANLSGPWIEQLLTPLLDHPIGDVHAAIVSITAKDQTFNPFILWKSLMENSTGCVQQRIMMNLTRLSEPEALQLLEMGVDSKWTFVQRSAANAISQFPYPSIRHLLIKGLESDSNGVRRVHQKTAQALGHPVA